jgi:hypothetical protein
VKQRCIVNIPEPQFIDAIDASSQYKEDSSGEKQQKDLEPRAGFRPIRQPVIVKQVIRAENDEHHEGKYLECQSTQRDVLSKCARSGRDRRLAAAASLQREGDDIRWNEDPV